MDDLDLIIEMRIALQGLNFDKCWDGTLTLESSLDQDPRYPPHERALVRQLRSQVSDLIAAKRDGLNLHPGSASATLTGSQHRNPSPPS
jgi:hypothetical protein